MKEIFTFVANSVRRLGEAIEFLWQVLRCVLKGKVRFSEVLKQSYEQGVQSVLIIVLTSFASGAVLALQGYVVLSRLGAKDYIAPMVAWSLLREMAPVFTAIIFSAKAGARIAAELGTMNVNEQILATRTMGVNPYEFLVVPRFLACLLVLPVLTIISEIVGLLGGYFIATVEANIPGVFYVSQTVRAIAYVDFFSGFSKVFFFAILIGWVTCFKGFFTTGGSLGVGRYTTQAVAYSIILVLLSNALLTKIILTIWQ